MDLIIYHEFLNTLTRLSAVDQKSVRQSLPRLTEDLRGTGMQFHKIKRCRCDPSFRSLRMDRDLRLIVSQQGDRLLLLYVGHHDDAYRWAEGRFLRTTPFQAAFISSNLIDRRPGTHDQNDFESSPTAVGQKGRLESLGLFPSSLEQLGVESDLAAILISISDDDAFLDSISHLPAEIGEALLDLFTGGLEFADILARLQSEPNDVDPFNGRDSARRFVVCLGSEELARMLEDNFELWKLFLHPDQKKLVEYAGKGPLLVSGGPGTGKTVVALHRSLWLASCQAVEQTTPHVLLCTYSRKLAGYLNEKIKELKKLQGCSASIDVFGVDQLLHGIMYSERLSQFQTDPKAIRKLFESTYVTEMPGVDRKFLQIEYEEIIQRYGITSLSEYLAVKRIGLKSGLSPRRREKIWPFFDKFLGVVREKRLHDFDDVARIICEAVRRGGVEPPYDYAVIDESQDLSPAKMRALTSLVREGQSGVTILADPNQQVHTLGSWSKDFGLDVKGRSRILYVNYRTTREIKEYADEQFLNSKPNTSTMERYKSLLSGPLPDSISFDSEEKRCDFIVKKIREFIEQGVPLHSIGIAGSFRKIPIISAALNASGIHFTYLKKDLYPSADRGVCVTSVQGVKGLEFRIMFLVDYEDLSSASEKHYTEEYIEFGRLIARRNDCLKYVAATRAREAMFVTWVES